MARNQDFTLNIKALFDTSDVKNKVNNLQNAFKNIKLPDNLQKSFDKTIADLVKSVNDFESKAGKGIKNKTDATGITKAIDNVIKDFTKVEDVIAKIQSEINSSTDLSKIIKLDNGTIQKIQQLKNDIKDLRQQIADITTSKLDDVNSKLNDIKSKGAKAGAQKAIELFNNGEIEEAIKLLDQVKQKQEQIKNGNYNDKAKATAESNITALNSLLTIFKSAQGEVSTLTDEINNKTRQLGETAQQGYKQVIDGAINAANAIHGSSQAADENRQAINDMASSQAQFNSEVDQLKSRIQYFFGLNNAIQLVKRAVRDAYETIKELDKAMTETAVVTDFSVGDMWKQLPEYTKRANELGVTTKAAYEAATLYYQQGLNTEEVNALSVETLKMARIASLDAAEATDRMTNALRGFNMELNETNAQRVDDVYSRLAAISASNVDEISTAMTKVASLAHNANMEFETTAAFLAQIIETTRESAETAGTALKTVVARFSEVKKLYDKGQLEGSDEEGEGINVNKVSSALRTAGIDLNKYFLGKVGLDDIFLELAERWDSLTAIQQRYIATQAAGSRQQSRFIALMSDYARTQELVSEAYNADGAAAQQFEKTQESLESKLARLKNAWDEFVMGLTNNTIVKGGIDLLITLLNTINSLTSSFGEGAGAIAKWVIAAGSLRGAASLFKNGGLISKILSNSFLGNALGGVTGASTIAAGPSLLSKFGAGIVGKTLTTDSMAALMPGMIGTTEALLPALGAIAGAVLAIVAAYKLWLKYTPEGQLKTAKKTAEELQKTAKEAQNTADSLKNLQDSYNSYTTEIENASSVTERKDAIKARNDAILKAIDENPNYSQYLRTDFDVDGELILTLDEGQVTQAAIDAAKEATKAAVDSYFGQANVALKQAQILTKKQEATTVSFNSQFFGEQGTQIFQDTSPETEVLKQNYIAAAKSQASLAYATMIKAFDTDLVPEVSKGLINAFSEVYIELAQKGKEIPDGIFEAIINGISSGDYSSNLFKIFSAENIDESMFDINTDNLDSVLDLFGIAGDELESLEQTLGDEEGIIRNLIKARAAEIKEIQKSNRSKVYNTMLQSGAKINQAVQNFVNSLSPEKVEQALDLLMSSSSILTPEQQKNFINNDLQNIFNAKDSQAQIEALNYLFNSINLNNPIKSVKILNSLIQDGPKYAREYAQQILEVNKASFSKSNMLQSFLSAEGYEDVAESISKIYKETGRLTPKNIADLASESEELAVFINEDVLSVRQLSEALEAINNGAPIEGLTDNVLDAFDATADLDDLLWDLHDTIQNFNAGLDYGEGTDFIVNLTDQLLEMTENYEFGNQQYKNIYTQLFGPEAYNEFMSKYGTMGIEDFTAMAKAQIERLKDWADEESYGFMMASAQGLNGIQGISGGPDNFTWDIGTKTVDQLRDYVAKTLGVSIDTAMGLVEGAMAHMPDLRVELKTNEYKAAINELVKSTEDGAKITQAQLEVIAAKYGVEIEKNIDQIKADIQEVAGTKQFDFPVIVNWVDENTHQLLTKESLINKFDKEVNFNEAIEEAFDGKTLNIDKLFSNLSEFGLTDDQAKEIAEHIREQLQQEFPDEEPIKFSKDVEVKQFNTSNGQIEVEAEITTLTSTSLDDLDDQITAKVQEGLQDANYKIVSDSLAEYDFEEVRKSLQEALDTASRTAQGTLSEEWAKLSFKMTGNKLANDLYEGFVNGMQRAQEYAYQNPIITPVQQQAGQQAASGGIVKSLAGGSGNQFLQPGWALTGEEAPEIVWNKEQGYAYITGANGPEFRILQPGDRVFNAQETSRILRNSSFAKGGYVDSFARGSWNSNAIQERRAKRSGSGGSGSSGSSGEKEPTKEEWRSDFDWLYNLMEDIAELQREQNKLQEEQNKILELANKNDTGKDLYENLVKQMANLLTQKTYQSSVASHRRQEMQEFMAANAGYNQYFRFNDKDQTLEINWDAINNIGDKETYEKVKDLVSEAEAIQKKMDESDDAVRDIEAQIRQLENIWREQFVDFEKRVLDALVKSYQRIIDNYSDLNDTVTRTNNDILTALQEEVALERQIRDNTKTEEAISDAEARLAFLKRDTTGGNQAQILAAQKQLDEQRREYEESLVDQSISRLQEDNEKAAEQREKQIELMQAQLNYAVENGEFNSDVYNLISEALGANGELLTNSDLFDLLQREESWAAMSATSKEVWEDELNNTFKEVSAYLLKEQGEADGSYLQAVASEINDGVWASANVVGGSLEVGLDSMGQSIGWAIGSMSQAIDHIVYSYDNAVNALSNANSQLAASNANSQGSTDQGRHSYLHDEYQYQQGLGIQTYGGSGYTVVDQNGKPVSTTHQGGSYNQVLEDLKKLRGYKTGGLTTKTGPAWLDGTPSEPEYVLNARQTDAFLKLAEVLPSMFNKTSTTTSNIGGNMYLEFHVNVDSISNDYDVDQLVERVKDDIYSAASYRNANVINFSR